MTTFASLFHVDTALVLSVVTAYLIPLVSALLTKAPASTLTGLASTLLAAISGFVAEWAANPHHYDWKAGVATAVAAWIVAVVAHTKVWKGGDLEAKLHAVGDRDSGVSGRPDPDPHEGSDAYGEAA